MGLLKMSCWSEGSMRPFSYTTTLGDPLKMRTAAIFWTLPRLMYLRWQPVLGSRAALSCSGWGRAALGGALGGNASALCPATVATAPGSLPSVPATVNSRFSTPSGQIVSHNLMSSRLFYPAPVSFDNGPRKCTTALKVSMMQTHPEWLQCSACQWFCKGGMTSAPVQLEQIRHRSVCQSHLPLC